MEKHKGKLIKNAIQEMESVMRPEVVEQVNREVEKQLGHPNKPKDENKEGGR